MSAGALELKVLFTAVDKFLRPVKAITDGARNASKALKETKDALKGLNDQQKLIDNFRSTNKALGIDGQKLEEARARVKGIAEAMAATEAPSAKMQRAFAAARDEAAQLSANVNRLTERKQRLRHELSAAGIDTKNLASQQRDLKGKIDAATTAVNAQSAALEAQNKKMQQLHAARAQLEKSNATRDKLGGTGAKLAVAGAAVNAAGAIPVMAYAKAEDSATQLKVAMMKKGGEVSAQFKEINDLAEKLGNKLPGTTSDYQDMMTMLIRQGMPAKALLGGLGEATAYLAVQLKMAPTAAAEFASKLQDATRTTDKDMMGLMDTIQKTFYLGVDQSNMLAGFSKLSPALSILKQEGLGAANALAPLLVMSDQAGMAGEAAGNAYRKIFQMSMDKKHVDKGNAALEGTGIKLDFTDGKGEFGGLDKMYAQLDKLKDVNTQQRLAALKKIFGDDAETLQALTIMIEKGADGYREVQGKMAGQANIQERVNLQLGTLKNLWDAASGTFTNALVAFGESIAPELHASAEFLGKLAGRVQAFAKENPGFAHAIMTTVKWLGLLLIVLGVLATGAAAVLGPIAAIKFGLVALGVSGGSMAAMLGGAFRVISSGIGFIGRALLMNPIGLAITGIAVAAMLIYTYWEPIKTFFSGLWGQVTQAFSGGLLGILALIANWSPLGLFYQAMAGVLAYFGIELPAKFTEFGGNLMSGLVSGITNGIQAAKEAIGGAGDAVVGFFKEKLGIHSPSKVFEELGGFTMQGLEQGLAGSEGGPLGAVSEMAKKLAGLGAGIVIGGAAMAGDIPLDARPQINPAAMAGAASGGGGNTYQITINAAPGTDTAGLAALVGREIERIEAAKAARGRSRLRDSE